MAESITEFSEGRTEGEPASSRAGAAASGRPRPGAWAASGPRADRATGPAARLVPGDSQGDRAALARGWVLVAPGGVPAAAGEPLAALLWGLRPARQWLASQGGAGAAGPGPGAPGLDPGWAGGEGQSSRNSFDSALADPPRLLAALAAQPAAWLWPLPLDPGAFLGPGGSWAEALGAWRQPCLLLIPAAMAASGPAAAYHALLKRQGVPLLGLIQWGGPWLAGDRRRDGLPWLGWLADPPALAAGASGAPAAAAPGLQPGSSACQPPGEDASAVGLDPGPDQAWLAAAELARALQLASQQLDLD